jgi:hypothetical protein
MLQGTLAEYSILELFAGAADMAGRQHLEVSSVLGKADFSIEGGLIQFQGADWATPATTPAEVCFDLLTQVDGTFILDAGRHDPFDSPIGLTALVHGIERVAAEWSELEVIPGLASVVMLWTATSRAAIVLDAERWRLVRELAGGPLTVLRLAQRLEISPLRARRMVAAAFSAGLIMLDGRVPRHVVAAPAAPTVPLGPVGPVGPSTSEWPAPSTPRTARQPATIGIAR